MDLDSWKPNDVYRRVSIAVCTQIAVIVGSVLTFLLGWPWFVSLIVAVLFGLALHALSLRLRR